MENCLIVLGMHRSGTSALTGVLGRLGVDLGDQLMDAAPDNPGGFFEDTLIVDTNEALLAAIGSSWDSPFALPDDWQDRAPAGELRRNATEFLGRVFVRDKLYALKDPRLSRLLPWWQPLFNDIRITGRYVILVRNPLEVAASLAERNGFSTAYSLLLWMHHMLEAERNTRGNPRAFVHYDDLLRDPAGTVRRLYDCCGLPAPDVPRHALADFIDARQRHHALGQDAVRERCPPPVAALYSELLRLAGSEPGAAPDTAALDETAAQFHAGHQLYHPPELAMAFGERRRLPDDLGDFLASPPWRLYRAYQKAVYRWLPEGTPLRSFLQKAKKLLTGRGA